MDHEADALEEARNDLITKLDAAINAFRHGQGNDLRAVIISLTNAVMLMGALSGPLED